MGVLALITLILSATAIYASMQIMESPGAQSEPLAIAQPERANPAEPQEIQEAQMAIPLALPEPTASSPESADNAEPAEQTIALALPQEPSPSAETLQADAPLQAEEAGTAPAPELIEAEPGRWVEEKVKSGDSLARIFSRLGLSANLLHRIVHSDKEAKQLANIHPGETLRVRLDDEDNLLKLIHRRSPVLSLQILPHEESFKTRTIERELEKRTATVSGTISDSLYQSAQRAGLDDSLIMELANIFGWDIDFALEIRSGDRFGLIYEEKYLDGDKYSNGNILAAEFINHGRVVRAVRYEDDNGQGSYFSPDGKSMRKAFLRAPVDFRRISSRFTRERYHPVLGKKRPHRGVDYAAATGTPIKAAGDGKVIFRGTKGGYGRTVIIQHGQKYTTLYGHLSKYRGKVKNGSRVRQGQVIGYVGKSGLATGPHLHYEFRVNGAHRNPLTVKLPAAEPIAKKYRTDFKQKSAPLLARLDLASQTMVATAEAQ
ncbi:peptidase M23 [Solemya velesiana gill symbiont]|uniref:Peptidase M23 n=1 Tax=Solemya velesiana gill symbiont TaxID=1918948 RepID=A0A1T2KXT4_9GAMM|nr:peptidase M23 [Solemya velesiana gill symbiont]